MIFLSVFASCTVEILKCQCTCVSKSRGLRTDHKRVKNPETQYWFVTQTMYACMNTSSSGLSCCIFNMPMECSLDIDINICPHIRVHECFRSKKKIYDMPNWKNLSVCDMYGSRSTVKLPPEEFTVIMLLPYIVMYGHSSPYCYVVVLAINACALENMFQKKPFRTTDP